MIATCCFQGVPPTRKLVFRSWLVVPGVAGGDADDGADRERRRGVGVAGPAEQR